MTSRLEYSWILLEQGANIDRVEAANYDAAKRVESYLIDVGKRGDDAHSAASALTSATSPTSAIFGGK